MRLRVTVCELHDDRKAFAQDWEQLVAHVRTEASDLVLLPEMPFFSWFARSRPFDAGVWQEAVRAHDTWQKRLDELAPAVVLSSRPVDREVGRMNEGFVWEAASGYRGVHTKYFLPEEEGFWEASWYRRGDGSFVPEDHGGLRIGFLICTELWFMDRARAYGKTGAHLLVTPRATERQTVDKWLAGGRAAAVISGAFGLSSNRVSAQEFGGQGWVIDPDGQVLGLTSPERSCVTVEIDPADAERAKQTYPRYVAD